MGEKKNPTTAAAGMVDLIRELIQQELVKEDDTATCRIMACNPDGTYDITILPDMITVISSVKSISPENLKQGDYAYIYKFKNRLNNAIIIARVGGQGGDFKFVTPDALSESITNVTGGPFLPLAGGTLTGNLDVTPRSEHKHVRVNSPVTLGNSASSELKTESQTVGSVTIPRAILALSDNAGNVNYGTSGIKIGGYSLSFPSLSSNKTISTDHVSGTNDGTYWTTITINGATYSIGSGTSTDNNQTIKQGSIVFNDNAVIDFTSVNGSHITVTGDSNHNTMSFGVTNGYSIPSDNDQTAWTNKYDLPAGGIPDSDIASASTWNAKYTKPADGIPSEDVAFDYAGSSSKGGPATSANKLNTNAGSATQPVYFANGVPVATTYALNKTVPADAVFTDRYHTAGSWNDLTYTLVGNGGASDISITIPTGTTGTTVALGNHTHSEYVPYTGANDNVNLGYTHSLTAKELIAAVNNSLSTAYKPGGIQASGSIGGSVGSATYNFPFAEGTGTFTLATREWVGTNYQTKLTPQTAYSGAGSSTTVPKITTNELGQVTNITEVTITDKYHEPVWTSTSEIAKVQIATGQDGAPDMCIPVASVSNYGLITLGYTSSGKNYAVQLDANGKAFVNVPWSEGDNDNQKVKAGSVTFGNNDTVNFVGSGVISVTGLATGDGAPKITISADLSSYATKTWVGDNLIPSKQIDGTAPSGYTTQYFADGVKLASTTTPATTVTFSFPLYTVTSDHILADRDWVGANYLGLYATADNSDKLDGHDSSYFYQASNPDGYTSNIGTVTQVKVGTTEYDPTAAGVVSLPAYPTKDSWNYDDRYLKLTGGTVGNPGTESPLFIKSSNNTGSFIGFYLSDDTTVGYLGINNLSQPVIKVGSTEKRIALYNELPSVSNATITVKQTGIADQTFTLNGPATTITLVDTWRPLGTGANDAAAGNHTHDTRYLKLTGGTLTGDLTISNATHGIEFEIGSTYPTTKSYMNIVNGGFLKFTVGSDVYYLGDTGDSLTDGSHLATEEWVLENFPTDNDNQKVKAGNVTFGINDTVDFVGGDNITVTGLATGTGAPKITISTPIAVTSTSVTDGTHTFNKYVHPTYSEQAAGLYKIGRDSTGHVIIGDAFTIPTSFNITVSDDILDGTGGANSVKYAPYSAKGAGHLYTGTTNPSSTNRLNYDGYFYATKLYSNGKEVLTDHQAIPVTDVTVSGTSVVTNTVAALGSAAGKSFTSSVTSGSNDLVTSGAVYTAITSLPAPMVFKGTLGTGGTITTLPPASASNEGYTYKVITEGEYAGQDAKVGDVFVSVNLGTDASPIYTWVLIPAGDTDSDTWRAINVNGTELLGNGITTGAVNFKDGTNITITGSGGDVTIAATDRYHSPVWPSQASITKVKIATGQGGAADMYLPQASSSDYGLIKLGYSASGKNYAVQVDSNGKAYVNVPWSEGDNDNQKVKAGSVTFGNNDTVNFVGSGVISVTGLATGTGAPKITISADLSGYVPYSGASGDVNLGSYAITANQYLLPNGFLIYQDNEDVYLETTQDGNLLFDAEEIYFRTGATDKMYLNGNQVATRNWVGDNYQTKLTPQTAYTEAGSSTKVPKITTNDLGQVTSITEVTITDNNDNQTVKGNGTAFGVNDAIDIVGSGVIGVAGDTTNKKITISADLSGYATESWVDNRYLKLTGGTIGNPGTESPLSIKSSNNTGSFIGFSLSNGTTVGYLGINSSSYPVIKTNGTEKRIALYSELPSVSNATITIKQTGIADQTFTLNGSATTITLADTNTWRNVKVDGTEKLGTATSTGALDFLSQNTNNGDVSFTYDSTNKGIKATAKVPTSFDITVTDDILDGTGGANSVKYAPYSSKGAGHLYTGTTNPSSTNRLNYDGYFYATKLYSGGSEVLTGHQSIKNLDTTATTSQSTSASEAIIGSGTIILHKVSKTGKYTDLLDTPTIGNGTLTVQNNGTTVNTFTANSTADKTVNILTPRILRYI